MRRVLLLIVSFLLLALTVGCSPTSSPQNNASRDGVIAVFVDTN